MNDKTNKEILANLEKDIDFLKEGQFKIHEIMNKFSVKLFGNGDIKGSLIWKVTELEEKIETIEGERKEIKELHNKARWNIYEKIIIGLIFVVASGIFNGLFLLLKSKLGG